MRGPDEDDAAMRRAIEESKREAGVTSAIDLDDSDGDDDGAAGFVDDEDEDEGDLEEFAKKVRGGQDDDDDEVVVVPSMAERKRLEGASHGGASGSGSSSSQASAASSSSGSSSSVSSSAASEKQASGSSGSSFVPQGTVEQLLGEAKTMPVLASAGEGGDALVPLRLRAEGKNHQVQVRAGTPAAVLYWLVAGITKRSHPLASRFEAWRAAAKGGEGGGSEGEWEAGAKFDDSDAGFDVFVGRPPVNLGEAAAAGKSAADAGLARTAVTVSMREA